MGGKQDQKNFETALVWLWNTYPKTFNLNILNIAKHNSLKTVLDLTEKIFHSHEMMKKVVSSDESEFLNQQQQFTTNSHGGLITNRNNRSNRMQNTRVRTMNQKKERREKQRE